MPGFLLPDPAAVDFDGYRAYIEEKMPLENPKMYGRYRLAYS